MLKCASRLLIIRQAVNRIPLIPIHGQSSPKIIKQPPVGEIYHSIEEALERRTRIRSSVKHRIDSALSPARASANHLSMLHGARSMCPRLLVADVSPSRHNRHRALARWTADSYFIMVGISALKDANKRPGAAAASSGTDLVFQISFTSFMAFMAMNARAQGAGALSRFVLVGPCAVAPHGAWLPPMPTRIKLKSQKDIIPPTPTIRFLGRRPDRPCLARYGISVIPLVRLSRQRQDTSHLV